MLPRLPHGRATLVVALAFVGWAAAFIRETAFTAVDGLRHRCLFDDAMISLCYGWNLAHGRGLVWNPGERVEGITNLLTTLTMALWSLPGSRDLAILLTQLFGLLCVLGTGAATVALWRRVSDGVPAARGAVPAAALLAAVLFYYPLGYWSLMGMETGLLAGLLTTAAWMVARVEAGASPSWALVAVLALATLTRPDAAVPAAVLLAARAVGLRRKGAPAGPVVAEAAALAAFGALVTAARWAYYGHLAPNTYVLKLGQFPLVDRVVNGLGFLRSFWLPAAPALLLALYALWRRPAPELRLLMALFAAAVGYQVYVGGDAWLYWRMLTPAMPGLFVAAVLGACLLGARVGGEGGTRPIVPAALVAALAVSANATFLRELTFADLPYGAKDNRKSVDEALAIRAVTREDATVGVVWAGSVPFFSERRGVDFLGKNDRYIASLPPDLSGVIAWHGMFSVPGHNKYDLNYSIALRRPTFIQRTTWGWDNLDAYAAVHYRTVAYKGVRLRLRRGDPAVYWDRVTDAGGTS